LSLVNLFFLFWAAAVTPEAQLRTALEAKTGAVNLSPGIVEISREIVLAPDSHDLDIRSAGLTIKASTAFRGRALIVIPAGKNIRIHDLSLDGDRDAIGRPIDLPLAGSMFSRSIPNNGIVVEGVTGLEIANLKAKNIAGFTILANAVHTVRIQTIEIADSGGLNARNRNNATGGILLEEGVTDFEVLDCRIANVRGTGIWVRSRGGSARNAYGRIADNLFANIGRDAIRVDYATEMRVENNRGRMIGYPAEEVDAVPAAIETAGSVDRSVYRNNQFEEIDGKCIGLDGFHDGEVTGNICLGEDALRNYPYGTFGIMMTNASEKNGASNVRIAGNTLDGEVFGGILLLGFGHTVTGNRLLHLNLAHCNDPGPVNCGRQPDQPELFRSGIYLGAGTKSNTIQNNEISGYGMSRYCIGAAPGVSPTANTIAKNQCSDEAALARAQLLKPR
jgi:hypothetical protein